MENAGRDYACSEGKPLTTGHCALQLETLRANADTGYMRVTSGDTEIFYEVLGHGPDVVLLHAFPVNHQLWIPAAQLLAEKHRFILPDLRGLGESGTGEGPATMEKHVADVLAVCDAVRVRRAVFAGVSIGGYILFELWRRAPERVAAMILCDTRAPADTEEGRAQRLRSAQEVEKEGAREFVDGMVQKVLGEHTRQHEPGVVASVRAMMSRATPAGIAAVLRGMAARPDSTATLRTIDVPALVIVGAEDTLTTVADAEQMREGITGGSSAVLPLGGHLAVFEQHQAAAEAIGHFLESRKL